jgi:hypothetical protein
LKWNFWLLSEFPLTPKLRQFALTIFDIGVSHLSTERLDRLGMFA